MANTEATCKCELTSQGFPPGYAQWFRENGDKVGAVDGNGSASLKLVYGSTGKTRHGQKMKTFFFFLTVAVFLLEE